MRIASGFNFGGSAPPNIVTNGLVLWLDSGNPNSYIGSGTTWGDMSRNANNATLVGSPTYLTDNRGLLDFDGTDDYATFNDAAGNSQYASAECWVKLDDPNSEITQRIISRGNSSTGTFDIFTQFDFFAQFTFTIRNSSNVSYLIGDPSATTSAWTHVVGTYNGTDQILYVNGVNVASQVAFGTLNVGGTYVQNIGRRSSGSQFANAKIPIVRLYNRALKAAEVTQNYNAQRGRFGV